MTVTITTTDVQTLVDEVLAEYGEEHQYPFHAGSCAYATLVTVDGVEHNPLETYAQELDEPYTIKPGCVVGAVLDKAGFDLEKIAFLEKDAEDLARDLVEDGDLLIDEDAVSFLQLVQRSQDNGVAWGRAVELAREGKFTTRDGSVTSNLREA